MKKNLLARIPVMVWFATFAIGSPLFAQQTHYKLIDMGTLGGPTSFLNDGNGGNNGVTVLNNRGALTGSAETSSPDPFAPDFCFTDDCFVSHAIQWTDGVRIDLGALDNDLGSQAVWISRNGLIAGFSENGEIDPTVSGLPVSLAVLWQNGKINNLGTLHGGFESAATAVNSKGQVIGWSTNDVPDANSMAAPGFLPTQTRAFLWQDGTMQDLGTLGGGDAIAQFINERGQVVGWSYTGAPLTSFCILPLATGSFIWDRAHGIRTLGNLGGGCAIATGINEAGVVIGDNVNDQTIQRAFIWKAGSIRDLGGTLGGKETGAEAINQSGEVAGFATLPGESLFHATLWRGVGQMSDLGTVGRDSCSFPSSIDARVRVVGASMPSCSFDDTTRAFLWENGSIFDLNDLIPTGATLHLQWAEDINDRGEIAGTGLDGSMDVHAFLLVPCHANSASDCQEEVVGDAASQRAAVPYRTKRDSRWNRVGQPRRRFGLLIHAH